MSWRKQWAHGRRRLECAARRAHTYLTQPRAELLYHIEYAAPDNPIIDPLRAQRIVDYLRGEGCVSRKQLRRPRPVGLQAFARVHDYRYLESVGDPALLERIFGEEARRVDTDALIAGQRRMVAGTVLAARLAVKPWRRGRPVVNLGGGLHHAHPDRGGGFCLFNDVAIAIRQLRAEGYAGRVLVVDLDLHQGDGTRHIFAEDDTVFTLSIHASHWDDDPAVADLNVELGASVGDRAYLEALDRYLPEAFEAAQPDLVCYVAGVDVAADDRLGSWRVSHDAIFERDRRVLRLAGDRAMVWVLAGGYGNDAWRHTARSLGWLLADHGAPVASEVERDLRHFRRIARRFTPLELSGGEEEDVILRAEDLLTDLVGPPRRRKLLGYYSQYGIELSLERFGVLPKLRAAGYPQVALELNTDHPTGHRLRVFSRDERRDLLIELVLREDGSVAPYRLLSIEWLLLQDPRKAPTAARPLLPGQQHPGLGVLGEVVGMLVMVCERLGFDGLLFAPAHFHVAAQAHGLLAFLDPADEAAFNALGEALAGLPLAQATRAVHHGEVVDLATGEPVRWNAASMVLPVSAELRAQLDSDEYDAAALEAGRGIRYERREPGRGPTATGSP